MSGAEYIKGLTFCKHFIIKNILFIIHKLKLLRSGGVFHDILLIIIIWANLTH